jgi:diguanylate cyclase
LAGPTYQEPRFVVASIVLAIFASGFAVFALGSRPNRLRLFAGAIVLGLAISGMHYTAMAGMRLDPLCFDVSRFVGAESALSRNTLALLATVISFGVSGAFLLSLVPDSQPRTPRLMMGPEALAPAAVPAMPIPVADIRSSAAPATRLVSPSPVTNIRVEKDGRPRFLAVGDIYAVRANAHYAFVHDGEREYFCNQSISVLEAELDPAEFARVHRSYIIRLARVSRIRRSGEAAVAELGEPVRCAIPIARGQYREIKVRIEALQRGEGPSAHEMRQSN